MQIRVFLFVLISGLAFPFLTFPQVSYSQFFTEKTFRFDYILAGDFENTCVYPQQMLVESEWAGSRRNLTDPFDYGTYRFRVLDQESGTLIFSKGFATLFQEWQTTAEAKNMSRAFYQGLRFPFPKKPVLLIIEHRNWNGEFNAIFETVIRPDDYFIRKEVAPDPDITYTLRNGDPAVKIDLVFLAEGYAHWEKEKFLEDVKVMTDYLFSVAPFDKNIHHFNVAGLWTPSQESGTDIPGESIYKKTRYNSTFYTFDLDRYLTTSDMLSVYDNLGNVPWDHTFILVNSTRYGGGGFYNFMGIGTTGHYLSKKVMVHEFGHSFAGLGDEYYDSEVAYENYYNLEIEPWEPNITTMVDFESKWQDMIPQGIPVPTPREAKFKNTVGVFEGGGYMSKGIFSPAIDCRMKSNGPDEFCPVCQRAIQRMIDLYTE